MSADFPWGFLTILLLVAPVLGSRYFSYWYDNIGRCGLSQMYKCIVVRTPSLQLGVFQNHYKVHSKLIRSHLLTSLVHTSGGIQSKAATGPLSTKAAQVRHKGVNPFTSSVISS